MERATTIRPIRLPAFAAIVFSGSGQGSGADRRAAAERFSRGLDLAFDGATFPLPRNGPSVHQSDDGSTEVIEGNGREPAPRG